MSRENVIKFCFEEGESCTATAATSERIRRTIETQILQDLDGVCHSDEGHPPHAVVSVSGDWVGGRFEVNAIETCCLHFASEIYNKLLAPSAELAQR